MKIKEARLRPVKGSLAEQVEAPDAVICLAQSDSRARIHWSRPGRNARSCDDAASIITRSGEWIGKGWVRVARGQAEQDSMLAREKVIGQLQGEISELSGRAGRMRRAIRLNCAKDMERAEAQIPGSRAEYNALHRKRNEVDGQLESRQSSIAMMDDRQQNISSEKIPAAETDQR